MTATDQHDPDAPGDLAPYVAKIAEALEAVDAATPEVPAYVQALAVSTGPYGGEVWAANDEDEGGFQKVEHSGFLPPERWLALRDVLDLDPHFWADMGPRLTCGELTAFASLLDAFGEHESREALVGAHVDDEHEDDEEAAQHGAYDVTHPWFDPRNLKWQALSLDDRRARLQRSQDAEVLEKGYGIVGVFPTEESIADGSMDYHFAYTYGRAIAGKAELVVVGMSSEAGSGVISGILERVDRGEIPEGVVATLQSDPTQAVVLAPVPDEWVQAHMFASLRVCRTRPVRAVQLLWTDDEGRWPWHPDRVRENLEGGLVPIRTLTEGWRPEGVE